MSPDGDPQTLTKVLQAFADDGFAADIRPEAGGRLLWSSCGHSAPATEVVVAHQRRLEGASDPDDLLLVVAAPCPTCGVGGAAVLAFGPTASEADTAVLELLPVPPETAVS